MKSRPPRTATVKALQPAAQGSRWRHSLQDMDTLVAFVNLRPKHESEFEEAVAFLTARPVPKTVTLHSQSSKSLIQALTGTALNAPLRVGDIVLFDPKKPAWKNRNAQRSVLPLILALRQCAYRMLNRLVRGNGVVVNGVARPELDPKSNRIDFVVNGRAPIDNMTFGPAPQFHLPVVYDVQDALFAQFRNLIDRTLRPARLRWHDGGIVPYWPLDHCFVCGKFFFKSRTNRDTCSRRCTLRWDHRRRQRTVIDGRTGRYLKQHNLRVKVKVLKVSRQPSDDCRLPTGKSSDPSRNLR